MRVLAIDTALTQCAVGVVETERDEPIASESIAMERGHAETLLPMLDRVMSRVGGGFGSIGRIAVTVGPGSFTGLRVGIAAARAIGLATGASAVGVTTLSALIAPELVEARAQFIVAAIDARGGRLYAQVLAPNGRLLVRPSIVTVKEIVRALGSGPIALLGSGAAAVAAEAWTVGLDVRVQPNSLLPDIVWVARLGAAASPEDALPKPFYLAAPDAKPQDAARLPRQ